MNRKLAEILGNFADELGALSLKLKKQIDEVCDAQVKAKISELTFDILNWLDEKGSKLGDFQVAYKRYNIFDKWNHAFQILRVNNAVISNRFQEKGYAHSYWIFPEKYIDRIFKKCLG